MYFKTLKQLLNAGVIISAITVLYLIVWGKANCEITTVNFIAILSYFAISICGRVLIGKLKES
jgi:hypothetical protein